MPGHCTSLGLPGAQHLNGGVGGSRGGRWKMEY